MTRLAFAGFRHGHINGLYKLAIENPGVEIAGAHEEDPDAREAAAESLGVVFDRGRFEDILNDGTIDVVVIGDYFGKRGDLALKSLQAGKHVYSDKPLCTSMEELDKIEELAEEKGLKVGLMLDMRYSSFARPVKKILDEGKLGEIHAGFFSGQHPLLYGTRPAWYYEKGKHGGVINDIAIHGVDMIGYLTGLTMKRPVAARCWNAFAQEEPDFKDSAQFMMEMSNNAGIMADVSYSAPDSSGYTLPFYWRFTLWGSKGVIEFGYNMKEIKLALNGKKDMETIRIEEKDDRNCLDVFLKELEGGVTQIDTKTVIRVSRETLKIQSISV